MDQVIFVIRNKLAKKDIERLTLAGIFQARIAQKVRVNWKI